MVAEAGWAATRQPLKVVAGRADLSEVRYQRLILEAGDNAVTVRFHPRLTVIAGVGRQERELLITELLGSLSGGRPGANLELVDDGGRRLALIRPAVGGERVLDVETGEDVTEEFVGDNGRPDLLSHLGLTLSQARQQCRLSAAELAVESQGDTLVATMATLDQPALWRAAERLAAADQTLLRESKEAGADVEDAPLIEEIERRHADFENAQKQQATVRRHGAWIAGGSILAAGAVELGLRSLPGAIGFAGIAVTALLMSIMFRRRMQAARIAENEALAKAGKQSYIGFQLQRVDRMLDGQKSLARVALASEEQRQATAEWRALAGDIAAEWALQHRDEITAASERRRLSEEGAAGPDLDPAELAHWLAARFTALRRVGPAGESLPLILDDPLMDVDAGVKQWILELIGRSAGSPQVVYLTADPEVAAWARLESMTGNLAVLEPAPENESAAMIGISVRS